MTAIKRSHTPNPLQNCTDPEHEPNTVYLMCRSSYRFQANRNVIQVIETGFHAGLSKATEQTKREKGRAGREESRRLKLAVQWGEKFSGKFIKGHHMGRYCYHATLHYCTNHEASITKLSPSLLVPPLVGQTKI